MPLWRKRLNIEIDYEKLAEAIVKANNLSEQNKQENQSSELTRWLSGFISFFFGTISVLCWIMGVGIALGTVYFIVTNFCLYLSAWESALDYLTVIIFCIFLVIMFIFYARYTFRVKKEVKKETDKNFLVSLFSGTAAFVAMVIAAILLFRDVMQI